MLEFRVGVKKNVTNLSAKITNICYIELHFYQLLLQFYKAHLLKIEKKRFFKQRQLKNGCAIGL